MVPVEEPHVRLLLLARDGLRVRMVGDLVGVDPLDRLVILLRSE